MFDVGKTMAIPAVKLGLIAVLILVLQIPLLMVAGQVEERQGRQGEVEREFERGWGPGQAVWGPVLVVPYKYVTYITNNVPNVYRGSVQVLAEQMSEDVRLATETRHRGMFEATVYTADVSMRGEFKLPPLTLEGDRKPEFLWDEARLVFGVRSVRGLGADVTARIDGTDQPVEPISGGWPLSGRCSLALLAAPVRLSGPEAQTSFETRFTLRGSQSFEASPEGRRASVSMVSAWASPSFKEGMLPGSSALSPEGFSANWDVPGQAGSRLPVDLAAGGPNCSTEAAAGVRLLPAVATYLMVSRTMKYETLFLVLAFLTYFLFETASRVRIHPMQYGLLGLSVTLFPLILVSVAEPVGFGVGYAVATAAVLAQATLFTLSVTRRRALAAWFGAILAGLFGFLYVVLSLESYALLAGTVALFAILSVVMAATRRVAWSGAAG